MNIQVREYATLTCDTRREASMDLGVVSPATFEWLLELQQRWKGQADLLTQQGKQHLKLCSYVGYLQSPAGQGIEVLPKTTYDASASSDDLRVLLNRMLSTSLGLRSRDAGAAELLAMKQPLHEWIIHQFLSELASLVRRGLRFDYQTVEDECPFIRGQLNMRRQLSQTPDKAARFHVNYSELTPQRLENRLLRTALESVFRITRNNDNWRLANILLQQMSGIEPVQNPLQLLDRWADSKMLVAYRKVKPWCQLVLQSLNPHFQKGVHQGISLLFRMEQLYESYVGNCLRGQVLREYRLTTQPSRRHLLRHLPLQATSEQPWFVLKPDFLLQNKQTTYVMDAKWKLLDENKRTSEHKYDVAQADLYQMFAYGQKYLGGKGALMLIYPQHSGFTLPLPVFQFDDQLELWCVPFDLSKGLLVPGDWEDRFECFSLVPTLTAQKMAS